MGWAGSFLRSCHWEDLHNVSALGINKRKLRDYCMAIPVIAQALDFSVRVQAVNQLAKDTGDDGHRLLEFGEYCDWSWRELCESDKAEHVSFIGNFILPKSDCKRGSKMNQFRHYCRQRQQSSHRASTTWSSAAMPQSSGEN